MQHRADRTGATVKRISLYDEPAKAGTDEIISRMLAGINDHTRVLAVTWVHSSTGVKLPIAEMAQALEQLNAAVTATGAEKLSSFPALYWRDGSNFLMDVQNRIISYDLKSGKARVTMTYAKEAESKELDPTMQREHAGGRKYRHDPAALEVAARDAELEGDVGTAVRADPLAVDRAGVLRQRDRRGGQTVMTSSAKLEFRSRETVRDLARRPRGELGGRAVVVREVTEEGHGGVVQLSVRGQGIAAQGAVCAGQRAEPRWDGRRVDASGRATAPPGGSSPARPPTRSRLSTSRSSPRPTT